MSVLKSPKDALGALDAQTAASLVTAAADLVVVLDPKGIVRDIAIPDVELERDLVDAEGWRGLSWAATLTPSSRTKAAALLHESLAGPSKWRHLSHPARDGREVPVLYSAVALPGHKRVFVFGRDMRQLTALQQRLIDAQQSIERDYSKLRFLELRYRLLFQTAPDPVLMLNAGSQKIAEANPAVAGLIGLSVEQLTGMAVADLFAAADRANLAALLNTVRAGAAAEPVRAQLAQGGQAVTLGAALFRDETASLILLRLTHAAAAPTVRTGADWPSHAGFVRLVEQVPDGLVMTDAAGHVLHANAAFLDLVELSSEAAAVGEPLDRWLGRAGIDLQVLLSNLRQRDVVRLFATSLTGASGLATAIEVSAVRIAAFGEPDQFGFAIRNVDRRVAETRPGRELPRSVDQLTELIGRVALKDLVREATDMIERLCIETALELTHDNRASAAELLGLSRQSLYVKLRRYGLGDLTEAPA